MPLMSWGPEISVTRKEDYWYKEPFLFQDHPLMVPSVNTIPTYEIEFGGFPPWVPPDSMMSNLIPYSNNKPYFTYVSAEDAENWPDDYHWKLLIKFAEEEFPLDKDELTKLFSIEYKTHYTKPLEWRKNRIMLLWMYNVSIQAHSNAGVKACQDGLKALFPDLWNPIHKKIVIKQIEG